MRFKFPRNRVISSIFGHSIEFKKGEWTHVPPALYNEVIAAGGVSEEELPDDEKPPPAPTPEAAAERELLLFAAFEDIVKKNSRTDFTAGGMPHLGPLSQRLGFTIEAKERDAAWMKFNNKAT